MAKVQQISFPIYRQLQVTDDPVIPGQDGILYRLPALVLDPSFEHSISYYSSLSDLLVLFELVDLLTIVLDLQAGLEERGALLLDSPEQLGLAGGDLVYR